MITASLWTSDNLRIELLSRLSIMPSKGSFIKSVKRLRKLAPLCSANALTVIILPGQPHYIEGTENHDENGNPSLDDNEERPPEYEEVDVPSDLDAVSESENESESGNESMSFDEIAVENFSEGENGYMSSDATEMYFSNSEN